MKCEKIILDRQPSCSLPSSLYFAKGRTGFPWIDANIAQLKQEGWVSYEGRQSLAYFLTRGCLWISWEEGVKV